MSSSPRVRLVPGRDRPVRLGHPWVLSGSVDRVDGDPAPGDTVRVVSAGDEPLGVGDWDPDSQIRVRVHAFGPGEPDPSEPWLEKRLAAALRWRRDHPALRGTDALRLVHSEADGLPGLTVDGYADWLVVKFASPGMARRAERVAEALARETGASGAWLRGERTRAEGNPLAADRLLFGSVPESPVWIEERGRRYRVDLRHGQKTGFYLDQRDARDRFATLAEGGAALDLFAYSGGFARAALQGGARSVVAVESSRPGVALLAENAPSAEAVCGDAGSFLREDTRVYDLIVLDPPPLAKRRRDVSAATRAYKDLNLWALRRAAPGAHLLTFTCSHHVDAGLFRKVVFGAVADTGADVQLLAPLGAPPDHPVSLRHPQGEYLRGLLLRVVRPGA